MRQVEDLLFERGIDICHEAGRFRWNRFGPHARRGDLEAAGGELAGCSVVALAFLKRSMARFRDIMTLQKFASAYASIHNHFNHDPHLNRRARFIENRSATLAEWRELEA